MRVRNELRNLDDEPARLAGARSDVVAGVHELLGARRCEECDQLFPSVWEGAVARIPDANYHDASRSLGAAVWVTTRHVAPRQAIETGVAHGVTTALILDAMARNGLGHLWSIDLPPLSSDWRGVTGIAVPKESRSRWTYRRGAVERHLAPVLDDLPTIELYVHDALHTRRSMMWEFERAWSRLEPGGVLIADDIQMNSAFECFDFTDGSTTTFWDDRKGAGVGVALKRAGG